jgi:hypothetical protein
LISALSSPSRHRAALGALPYVFPWRLLAVMLAGAGLLCALWGAVGAQAAVTDVAAWRVLGGPTDTTVALS